jgi:hypothetical protein
MRLFCFLFLGLFLMSSCGNNSNTAKSLCDTACNNDSLKFTASHELNPKVIISVKNCNADTLTWTHEAMEKNRQAHMGVWLSFNDCITGRGYLLKLPFNKKNNIRKMASALNSFDPKFSVAPSLRAYADKSTIYVVNVNTDKEEIMTFKEVYDINWDKIHETIDSVNVTPERIYVKLIKNGQEIPLEKKISLAD